MVALAEVAGTAQHEPVGVPATVDVTVNAMGVATVGAPSQPEPAQQTLPALPKSQAHYLWAVLIARIYGGVPFGMPDLWRANLHHRIHPSQR